MVGTVGTQVGTVGTWSEHLYYYNINSYKNVPTVPTKFSFFVKRKKKSLERLRRETVA